MRVVNLVTNHDLLKHAENIGYSHNTAHKILFEIDGIGPEYEVHSRDYKMGDFDLDARENGEYYSYDEIPYSTDTVKIVLSFMAKYDIKKMTVVLS